MQLCQVGYKIFFSLLIVLLFSCRNNTPREAGICISFDDRTVREWYSLRKLFKTYDAKVTFFVTQFDSLDSVEIDMLKELEKDGHEIGSHGALHVISENYIKDNSFKEYLRNEVDASISAMRKKGFEAKSFAYPYGAKYWFTDMLLLNKFKVVRGVAKINEEDDMTTSDEMYYDFNEDHTVSAVGIDRNSGLTAKMIQLGIQRAKDQNQVLLLYGHSPETATDSSSYQFDTGLLTYILSEVKKHNLKYFKMSEL